MGYKNSRVGKYRTYARQFVRGATQAYGAYKRYGTSGRTGGTNRPGTLTTGITTDHYDKKLKYKYKRMPTKKRRKYRRRAKLVENVINRRLGSTYSTKFHVPTVTDVQPSSGTQEIFGVIMNEGLPLGKSTNTLGQTIGEYAGEVINAIQHLDNKSDSSLVATVDSSKYVVKSNGFNTILHNESSDTCIMDVYTIKCVRDLSIEAIQASIGVTTGFSLSNLYTWLLQQTDHDGTAPSRNALGEIPFQNKTFCKYFKILRVQEVQIPAGNTITLSMRSGKPWYWNAAKCTGKWCMKNLTQGYLFRARGVPTDTHTSAAPLSIRYVTEYHTAVAKLMNNNSEISIDNKT